MPSTVIRQISYETRSRRLIVVFQSGRVYAYHGVSGEVYALFEAARSKGVYFNEHIRDRYSYEQLDTGDLDTGD